MGHYLWGLNGCTLLFESGRQRMLARLVVVRVVCKDVAVCASPLVWETSWTLCCLVLHVFHCFGAVSAPAKILGISLGSGWSRLERAPVCRRVLMASPLFVCLLGRLVSRVVLDFERVCGNSDLPLSSHSCKSLEVLSLLRCATLVLLSWLWCLKWRGWLLSLSGATTEAALAHFASCVLNFCNQWRNILTPIFWRSGEDKS